MCADYRVVDAAASILVVASQRAEPMGGRAGGRLHRRAAAVGALHDVRRRAVRVRVQPHRVHEHCHSVRRVSPATRRVWPILAVVTGAFVQPSVAVMCCRCCRLRCLLRARVLVSACSLRVWRRCDGCLQEVVRPLMDRPQDRPATAQLPTPTTRRTSLGKTRLPLSEPLPDATCTQVFVVPEQSVRESVQQ
jgi:hypothetical protein